MSDSPGNRRRRSALLILVAAATLLAAAAAIFHLERARHGALGPGRDISGAIGPQEIIPPGMNVFGVADLAALTASAAYRDLAGAMPASDAVRWFADTTGVTVDRLGEVAFGSSEDASTFLSSQSPPGADFVVAVQGGFDAPAVAARLAARASDRALAVSRVEGVDVYSDPQARGNLLLTDAGVLVVMSKGVDPAVIIALSRRQAAPMVDGRAGPTLGEIGLDRGQRPPLLLWMSLPATVSGLLGPLGQGASAQDLGVAVDLGRGLVVRVALRCDSPETAGKLGAALGLELLALGGSPVLETFGASALVQHATVRAEARFVVLDSALDQEETKATIVAIKSLSANLAAGSVDAVGGAGPTLPVSPQAPRPVLRSAAQ